MNKQTTKPEITPLGYFLYKLYIFLQVLALLFISPVYKIMISYRRTFEEQFIDPKIGYAFVIAIAIYICIGIINVIHIKLFKFSLFHSDVYSDVCEITSVLVGVVIVVGIAVYIINWIFEIELFEGGIFGAISGGLIAASLVSFVFLLMQQNAINEKEEIKNEKAFAQTLINGQSQTAADELFKYKKLLDHGAISQEEYNKKKDELLNS